MKTKEFILDYLIITIAISLVSVAVFFFMVPSGVSVGSIAALSMILSNYIPLSVSVLTLIMNIGLLVIGFLTIGKEFGIKTVYTSIMMPIVLGGLELCFPNMGSLTNDQTLDVICYCVLVSFAQALLFVRNASSGGMDIVGKVMHKYLHMEFGKAVGMAGMAVALVSFLVSDSKAVVLGVLGTYFNGLVLDHFIFGNTVKKRVCILSEKESEIMQFILHELHSGATIYHAYGAYSDKEKIEINTIVDKSEYQKLMNFIRKIDKDAFVTVYAVNEMMYRPKVVSTVLPGEKEEK